MTSIHNNRHEHELANQDEDERANLAEQPSP